MDPSTNAHLYACLHACLHACCVQGREPEGMQAQPKEPSSHERRRPRVQRSHTRGDRRERRLGRQHVHVHMRRGRNIPRLRLRQFQFLLLVVCERLFACLLVLVLVPVLLSLPLSLLHVGDSACIHSRRLHPFFAQAPLPTAPLPLPLQVPPPWRMRGPPTLLLPLMNMLLRMFLPMMFLLLIANVLL